MAYTETTSGAGLSVSQAITTTADSTNIYDITGAGVGNLPNMIGANGVNTAIGSDLGATTGIAAPQILLSILTSTTVTGTLTVTLKGAPDSGTGTEGTYVTLFSSAALTGAQLPKGGQLIIPFPVIPPAMALPRFFKLTYTVTGSISIVVDANVLFNAPTIRDATLYGSNFVAL